MTKNDNLQNLQGLDIEKQLAIMKEMADKWEETNFNPESLLDEFEIYLYNKNVLYNNKTYLIGTFSTNALNFLIDNKMKKLQPLLRSLYKDYQTVIIDTKKKLQLEDLKKIDSQIEVIKSHLGSLIIFDDRISANNSLVTAYAIYGETGQSDDLIRNHASYQIISYIKIGDALISFFEHMHPFSRFWITNKSETYNHNYAQAFEDYFYNEIPLDVSINTHTILPTVMFQSTHTKSRFHSMELPTGNRVFGESLKFKSYLELLQYDYFKALQSEHTVRICNNCKRAFLQTTKHHTIYCDNIAPGYTDKTCREVGALSKQKEKVNNSPIHQLYKRCYKKLNQRYNRGTINLDEFNESITKISGYRDSTLHGKMTIDVLEKLLKEI